MCLFTLVVLLGIVSMTDASLQTERADVNTDLGQRQSMSLCDGNMLVSVVVITPFLIILNFQCAKVISTKHSDEVFLHKLLET